MEVFPTRNPITAEIDGESYYFCADSCIHRPPGKAFGIMR
jgi:YHS domain-containing protein